MSIGIDPMVGAAYFEIPVAQIQTTKEIGPGFVAVYNAIGYIEGYKGLSLTKIGLSAALNRSI